MWTRLLHVVGALLALTLLAALCWAVGAYRGWPLWHSGALLVAALGLAWAVRAVHRKWVIWHARRVLAQGSGAARVPGETRSFDQAWREGLRRLRQSRLYRLGGFGKGLYALPWFLMLGPTGAGKSALLSRTGLASTLRLVRQDALPPATEHLAWWYFDRSIVLDLAGWALDGETATSAPSLWQRVLHWLRRTRRREPLNGIVLTLSARTLLSAGARELTDQGRVARQRIDDLTRTFEARVPVVVVLTHCDAVPGLRQWAMALPDAMRNQAVGAWGDEQASPAVWLAQVFDTITERLADIRVQMGLRGNDPGPAIGFPEQVRALQAPLQSYLAPAFDANPYAETPLLQGLFLTAEASEPEGEMRGWFARQLFDTLMPGLRTVYAPIGAVGPWRRFMRHGGVVAWLAGCAVVGGAMTFSFARDLAALHDLQRHPPPRLAFKDGMASKLGVLAQYQAALARSDRQASLRGSKWLPFGHQLDRVHGRLAQQYAQAFSDQVLRGGIDRMLQARIRIVAGQGDSNLLLAAYAQHLVRRMNLLNARLSGQPLDALPPLGAELVAIESDADPGATFDPLAVDRFSALYAAYLGAQQDRAILLAERAAVREMLETLSLPARSSAWLLAWADLQGDLSPVTLGQFWRVADAPDAPRLSAAYTPEGYRAIHRFIAEMVQAGQSGNLWRDRARRFESQYRDALGSAWYGFIAAFLDSRMRLHGEDDWRTTISGMLGPDNPYRRLLQEVSRVFSAARPDNSDKGAGIPQWAATAIRLDRLWTAVYAADVGTGAGVLGKLRLANAVGGNALRSAPPGLAQVSAARTDFTLTQGLLGYRKALDAVAAEVAKGDGHVAKLAADGYAFAGNAVLSETPLVQAAAAFDQVSAAAIAAQPDDLPVWRLVRGPLDFSVDYASRVAASALQASWEAEVLAPLQGVVDPDHTLQLLYGNNGLIPAFMRGAVQSFVVAKSSGYQPRELLGQRLPLNGMFYAFAGRAQLERNDMAGVAQRDAARKLDDENLRASREKELRDLDQQMQALRQQVETLRAVKARVVLNTRPSRLNDGARVVPEKVSLALQCTTGTIVLNNFNFPASGTFDWSLQTCGDTTLTVQFPAATLTQRWGGAMGFVDFLRAFQDGAYTLDVREFPDAQKILAKAGVSTVTLGFAQQGQETMLGNFAEVDRLNSRLTALAARRDAVERAQGMQAAALPVGQAAAAQPNLELPLRIAQPWAANSLGEGLKATDVSAAIGRVPGADTKARM